MKHRYHTELNIDQRNSYYLISTLVNRRSKVLEIGTSSGYFTEYLAQELDCDVDGIEYDTDLAKDAKKFCKKIFIKDLEKIENWIDELKNEEYDHILFMDVLEHTLNPKKVVKLLTPKLRFDGSILVSIPNVSHGSIMIEQFSSDFRYTENGILDKTHYKWFTPESFDREMESIGLNLIHYDLTYMAPQDSGMGRDYEDIDIIAREAIIRNSNSNVFQGIFKYHKKEFHPYRTPPFKFSTTNFDKVLLKNEKGEIIHLSNTTKLKHQFSYVADKNYKIITLKPTLRFRGYNILIKINGKTVNLNQSDITAGEIDLDQDEKTFYSSGDQEIVIKNITQGDKIDININYKSKDILKSKIMHNIQNNEELNKIFKLIDKHDAVSFDVFDTLLLRNLAKPSHLFDAVQFEVERDSELFLYVNDFKRVRMEAEAKSRESAEGGECNLNDIYEVIKQSYNIEDNELIEKLKNIELNLERKFLVQNKFMKKVFDYSVSTEKKVLLLTDMYLPKEFIYEVLVANGYKDNYQLYVSNEHKKNKHLGTAYKSLLERKFVPKPSKWIHIGDNEYSDVIMAEKHGLKSYHYKPVLKRASEDGYIQVNPEIYPLNESIMMGVIMNKIYDGFDVAYWTKFGIKYTAPLYYGISEWIVKRTQGKEKLYFLARDGYILQKVFEIFEKHGVAEIPKAQYLYTSRKTYQLPGLIKETRKNFCIQVTAWNEALGQKQTIKEIFENLEFDAEKVKPSLEKFGFKSLNDISTFDNWTRMQALVNHHYEDIEKGLNSKLEILVKYLKQEGVYDQKEINVVDIGWRGSIQKSIQDITKKRTVGYYFGTVESCFDDIANNAHGYAFTQGHPSYRKDFVINFIVMYETLFTSPEGTLLGFKEDEKGKIIPVLDQENSVYVEAVEKFQKASLDVIEEILPYYEYCRDVNIDFINSHYYKMLFERKIGDIKAFENFTNNIGFSTKKKKYIETFTKEDFKNNYSEIIENCEKGMWRGAFLVEGINDDHEFIKFKDHYRIKHSNYNTYSPKIFSMQNFKRALNSPGKAKAVILRKIKNKIKNYLDIR